MVNTLPYLDELYLYMIIVIVVLLAIKTVL